MTAGLLFVTGAVLAWTGTMPVLSGADVCNDFGALPEGSSSSSNPDLFPPGTIACEYRTPAGQVTTMRYVPWFEWSVLAVGAVLAALLTVAVLQVRRIRRA
jgi:hypothetical protein